VSSGPARMADRFQAASMAPSRSPARDSGSTHSTGRDTAASRRPSRRKRHCRTARWHPRQLTGHRPPRADRHLRSSPRRRLRPNEALHEDRFADRRSGADPDRRRLEAGDQGDTHDGDDELHEQFEPVDRSVTAELKADAEGRTGLGRPPGGLSHGPLNPARSRRQCGSRATSGRPPRRLGFDHAG
jgi:hypothetical protein